MYLTDSETICVGATFPYRCQNVGWMNRLTVQIPLGDTIEGIDLGCCTPVCIHWPLWGLGDLIRDIL